MWEGKCEDSWKEFEVNRKLKWREKYVFSIEDSKRTKLSERELVRLVWAFRFKAAAGEFWQDFDPYWNGRDETHRVALLRIFTRDGFVRPIESKPDRDKDPLHYLCEASDMTIRWRFTKSRKGQRGCFVQINRWPSMGVFRNPINWGWYMHSQWVVYCSPAIDMNSLHDIVEDDVDRWV